MLVLAPSALQLFTEIPGRYGIKSWWYRVTKFCDYLDANHPEWREGLELVQPNVTREDDIEDWNRIRAHLFRLGMKFQLEGCQSYWFIKTQKSKWVGIDGEHTLTELCYVSLFGDTFAGHATEYFDPRRIEEIQNALTVRVAFDRTTKPSGIGVSVQEAITEILTVQ
jgi:predicted RNA-binding protein with PUA-like domain